MERSITVAFIIALLAARHFPRIIIPFCTCNALLPPVATCACYREYMVFVCYQNEMIMLFFHRLSKGSSNFVIYQSMTGEYPIDIHLNH